MQITRCVAAALPELVFLNPDHHHHHWHPKALMFHLVRIFFAMFKSAAAAEVDIFSQPHSKTSSNRSC